MPAAVFDFGEACHRERRKIVQMFVHAAGSRRRALHCDGSSAASSGGASGQGLAFQGVAGQTRTAVRSSFCAAPSANVPCNRFWGGAVSLAGGRRERQDEMGPMAVLA